jgi:hypothetical protein
MSEPTYRDYLGTLKVNMAVAVIRLERALKLPPNFGELEKLEATLPIADIVFFESVAKDLSARL